MTVLKPWQFSVIAASGNAQLFFYHLLSNIALPVAGALAGSGPLARARHCFN